MNLWIGLVGAGVSLAVTVIGATQTAEVAQQWAIILGAVGAFLGILIAFLANQAPTVNAGDTVKVVTAAGEPNKTIVV